MRTGGGRGRRRSLGSQAAIACTAALWLSLGCSETGPPTDPLVKRGRAVYLANCIACHATDPTQAGGIGPDVADASLELLEARLIRNEYPAGYTPKRDSGLMPPFPHLEPDLPALHAFLAAAASSE